MARTKAYRFTNSNIQHLLLGHASKMFLFPFSLCKGGGGEGRGSKGFSIPMRHGLAHHGLALVFIFEMFHSSLNMNGNCSLEALEDKVFIEICYLNTVVLTIIRSVKLSSKEP